MKKTKAALLGLALIVGVSGVAAAQGGGGGGGFGGGGRGRGPAPISSYNQLFTTIKMSMAQQAKIDTIGRAYTDSINVVAPTRGGGPGGGPGGPPTPFSALPDSVQKRALDLVEARNKAFAAILDKDQKKQFDEAVAADAKLRGINNPGGV